MDYTIGGAISVWCEGGGVIGAGASEIRESATCDVDIGVDEIAGRLCEGESYGSRFACFECGDIRGDGNFGWSGVFNEAQTEIGDSCIGD